MKADSEKPQICTVCTKPIKPGDGVAIDRGQLMHIGCYEKATRKP
jgi:hypothetical protein